MTEALDTPTPTAPPAAAPAPATPPSPPPAAEPAARSERPVAADPRRKSPFLACVLSAMPGLGQVYVGYYPRGFVHALVVGTLITLLVNNVLGPLIPLASLFLAFFWLHNVIDAGRRASLYNQALAGGVEIDLPDDFEAPGIRGSLVGGSVLAGVGLILLANTLFGISLAWVESWWPLLFVGFGAYLVWKALEERREADGGSSSAPYLDDE